MMRLALGIILAALCAATPARAALTLCNRTSYVLYAATAAIRSPQAQTQGWTRIAPGECQVARKEDLTAETYLVYARSSLAHGGPARAWGGNFPICVKDANFNLNLSGAMAVCSAEGSFAVPFASLATGGRRNWTMTLDETPPLPSLVAAQLAGVKRLLRDNGYQTGPIDGVPDKQTGAALAAFRKRVGLSNRGGNSDLFTALEAQAQKTNAPAGYTVCNDGDAALDVALAQVAGGKTVSRGWWTVPRGACARPVTAPLTGDSVYLLARRKNGAVVAGGPEKFCIAPAAFEIRERGNCAARGQQEAGFLRDPANGRPGIVAHIGNGGLRTASGGGAQASMSK